MKISSDGTSIEVVVTRSVEGRQPQDIWLSWGRMRARITVDEARELADSLMFAQTVARQED
jgi:hypothetical protein